MLKAIQILGSSSGFVIQYWKPRNCTGQGLFSISIPSKSSLSLSLYSSLRIVPAQDISFVPKISVRRTRFRAFHASSTRSEPNPEGPSASSSSSSSSLALKSAAHVRNIKFCQWCGGSTKHDVPEGEERMRAICTICGKITYQNPKMVVGCLVEHDNKVLLCKRKIQPSYGLWTLPAGYLEIGESAVDGAIRETREEANADVEVLSPFVQLDIPIIGQTYIIFLAKLKKPHFSPGPESSDCRLFPLDDIPFNSLSFSSMVITLSLYVENMKAGRLRFHYGTINKRPGTSPSDIQAYTLDNHMQS
ncbi:hypothetical protein L6164_009461 [Bauhinia variegata]|uniref:Uncharacterized protein n=1 Tax=Bauhinia variegata TaxID=167791 RepID=A0ACB9PL62_BAUVA|nr:hypothetical protein L6164_009461 [Bauhinia variegata]